MGWIGVLTNAGNALLAEWALGSKTLNITGATVGSGTVAQANMRNKTALTTEKMTASIAEKKAITNGVNLRVRIGPASALVGAFTAHEIGIWANLDGGADVLLSYHMDDDVGVSIPAAATSPDFFFDLICPEVLSNDGSLSVTIDSSVHITLEEWENAQHQDWLMEEGLPNCEATPTYDANGDITGMTHVDVDTSDTMRTDVYTRTSTTITEVRTLASGEVLTITTDLTTQKTTYIFS